MGSDVSAGLTLRRATYWAQCTVFISMYLIAKQHSLQSVPCEHQMRQFVWLYKQIHNIYIYNILSLKMMRIHRNMLECLLLFIYIYQ